MYGVQMKSIERVESRTSCGKGGKIACVWGTIRDKRCQIELRGKQKVLMYEVNLHI